MKTLSLLLSALLIPALLFTGCSSNQKVLVSKETEREAKVLQTQYKEYEDALLGADFSQAERLSASEDQRQCVKAYELFASGDEKQSEKIALSLVSSKDSLVSSYSKQLVSQIYFSQCRWADLSKFDEQTGSQDMAEKILSAAYASIPKEEIIFDGPAKKYPITMSSSGSPIVEVEVNGVKKHFWFDTGAGLTVIASDAAEECNVKPVGKDTAVSGTSTTMEVGFLPAGISELKIAGVRVKNHPAMIFNKKDLEFKLLGFITIMKIDGIIGWNLIEQLGWDVDYKNKTIQPFNSETITNSYRPNFIWFGYPTVTLKDYSGKEMLFGMDTGAGATSLSENFITDPNTVAETESKTYGGAGGFQKVEVQKLENISLYLTGNKLFFPEIYKKNQNVTSMIKLHGVLGSDFLKENRLIVDFPHRKMIME